MLQSKSEHFRLLAETSAAVWPGLEEAIRGGLTPELREAIQRSEEVYLSLRRGKPLLRPLLARYCLQGVSSVPWQQFLPLLEAVELFNISTYQSNFCFDEKGGVEATAARNNQFISSMITFSRAVALASDCAGVPAAARARMAALLAEANREVYEGQFSDLNVLTIEGLVWGGVSQAETFQSAYLRRCLLIAGSTFRTCALPAIAAGADDETLRDLNDYLTALGAAAQAVNDLGDFIPHRTKAYASPFADFRLGRLTLPNYLLASVGLDIIGLRRRLLADPGCRACEEELTAALVEYQVERGVRIFIKRHLFPRITSALARLAQRHGASAIDALYFAVPYIFESRMLRYFRADRERAWPPGG